MQRMAAKMELEDYELDKSSVFTHGEPRGDFNWAKANMLFGIIEVFITITKTQIP